MNTICFDSVSKRYGKRTILNGVSIEMKPGHCHLLHGENGSGKSTLLRIIAGMERPDHADVTIDGHLHSWRKARKQMLRWSIYLHQSPYLFDGTVWHNLAYPLSGSRDIKQQAISKALKWAGLEKLADQKVHTLSGGERQRVALARAWLRKPRLMLLDEPTANMDDESRVRTLQLLFNLKQEGMALLVVSHDPGHFLGLGSQRLRLADGEITELETPLQSDNVTELVRSHKAV